MRGTVHKRGQTWTFVVDVGRDPLTGKRKQRTKGGFRTRKDCQSALTETLTMMRSGTLVAPSKMTLGRYLTAEWLPAIGSGLRPSTLASYRMNVEAHVVPRLGGTLLQQLSPGQLNAFYSALLTDGRRDGKGGLSPRTVSYVHVILHRALKDAMRWGYVVRNVAELADPPRSKSPEMQVWAPEQLRAFLEAVRSDRLYAGWLLTATTGLRRGEVVGLRWEDVDLEAGRIQVRAPRVVAEYRNVVVSEPKTAKGRRSIRLDPATVGALRAHKAAQAAERLAFGAGWPSTGLVFVRADGEAIHPQRFSSWFEQHVRRAGLPMIRLHDVRHSYATAALSAGVPAKVVSERLGHASIGITLDTYSHVLPGMDEQAANQVAALILGG